MSDRQSDLLRAPHNGHLSVHALKRHRDEPVLHIQDQEAGQEGPACAVLGRARPRGLTVSAAT